MLKRQLDIWLSLFGLIITTPLLVPLLVLIWLQDFASPFYIAPRVGKGGRFFRMVKLRSMVVDANRTGVDSTSAQDRRITPIGNLVRSYKLDELPQLWNVLRGEMSLVGPRPNVPREVALYTSVEEGLLTVQPGITDLASIVFADLGEILQDSRDPNIRYNQLVRPWKSRLGLAYINNISVGLDLKIIALTFISIFSRQRALSGVQSILKSLRVGDELLRAASRQETLVPTPPPGASAIVTSR